MVAGSPNTSVNTNKSRENSLATKIARLDKKVKFSYRLLYARQIFTKRKLVKPH